MSSEITVTIKCTNSETASIVIDRSCAVLEFKQKISEKLNIPANIQRLVFKGKVLKDELTLEFYGKETICCLFPDIIEYI